MAKVSKRIVKELEEKYLNGEIKIDDDYTPKSHEVNLDEVIYAFATLRTRSMTLSEVFKEIDEYGNYFTNHTGLTYTRAIYKAWVDLEAVKSREDNILTRERKDASDWKVDYEKSLSHFVFDKGYAVPFLEDSFSRQDFFVKKESIGTPIGFFNIHEESWSEFAGTFVDHDEFVGVTVDVVGSNGVSQKFRVNKSLGEVIREITK